MTVQDVIDKAKAKGYTMRAAQQAESASVKQVAVSAFGGGWENNPDDCVHYTKLGNGTGTLQCTVIVEDKNNLIAGYIFYKQKNGDLYVSDTGVMSAYQGKGLGALLMAYALAWAKENNIKKVTLYTAEGQDGVKMRKVYRNTGFKKEEFGYTTDDDSGDEDSYPMSATVNNSLSKVSQKV